MAEMMEALQRRLEFAFLGGRFWTFAQIGAILVLLTSFSPFFAAYNITALVVLACSITWDLWRNAPKSARYGLALVVLGAFVFLLYNTLAVQYGWPGFHHPAEAEAAAYAGHIYAGLATGPSGAMNATAAIGEFSKSLVAVLLAYAGGAIANLFFLVSGLMGLMAARRA